MNLNIMNLAKLTLAFSLGSSVVGCGKSSDASLTASAYPASHCELFIDKVLATKPNSSHAGTLVKLYVKTLNNRLDAPIAEVGFRNKVVSQGDRSSNDIFSDTALGSFLGSNDYWEFTAMIHNGIEPFNASYQGAFYVKTTRGTVYWLNDSVGGNFVIDTNAFINTVNEMDVASVYGASFDKAVATQGRFGGYYNPAQCR